MSDLLTRDGFREAVFARDGDKCVVCGAPAADAHHLLERRLWPDGGYYLDNGASLCAGHHLEAEETVLSVERLREFAGISRALLPPHLYSDTVYDKWGNPVLPNDQRIRGELFDDPSVQKVLRPVLFQRWVKYPRTYHLPWSPGVTKDDRVMPLETVGDLLIDAVVITEKMDGENTTMYRDYLHARSLDYSPHPSRDRVKALWGKIAHDIPEGWRLCGENVYARHSIAYEELADYFLLFSVWNEKNECLSWSETEEWAQLLSLSTVPVLSKWPRATCMIGRDRARLHADTELQKLLPVGAEGYVVRRAGSFPFSAFRRSVAKWVRKDHVQTHGHWMRQAVVPNKLKEGG